MAKCSCCGGNFTEFNSKTPLIENFIALIKQKRDSLGNVNERQLEIYDNYIRDLELSPRTITMRDVRNRHIIAEDYMECECKEEDEYKDYLTVFDSLWIELRSFIREEIRQAKISSGYKPVLPLPMNVSWESNPHFCPECKEIYDRTVKFGLMNEDYSWKDTTTKKQIAEWVDLFAFRFKISKKWIWAEETWGLSNLSQRKYENAETKDLSKLDIVHKIFDI